MLYRPGKPAFQSEVLKSDNAELHSFVGERSWLLFELVDARGTWLQRAVDQWACDPEFDKMNLIIKGLEVTNDTAERGIKDIEDYSNSSTDPSQRRNIILAVNKERQKVPNFDKKM